MSRNIIWSEDFDRQFKKLARKRGHIFADLGDLLEQFEAGRLPGKVAQGVRGLPVKVVRMRDRSSNRGKSSGFRVAYYYDDTQIFLTFITKRDRLDQYSTSQILDTLRSAGFYPD